MSSIQSVHQSASIESNAPLTSVLCDEYECASKENSMVNVRIETHSAERRNEVNDAILSRLLTTRSDTANVGIDDR